MAKRWYNRDDVVVSPEIAAEAAHYAKLGVALAEKKRHERKHTCPHCKRYFGAIDLHMRKSHCARVQKNKERGAVKQRERAAASKTAADNRFYRRSLGEPVRGSLAWALLSGTFRK